MKAVKWGFLAFAIIGSLIGGIKGYYWLKDKFAANRNIIIMQQNAEILSQKQMKEKLEKELSLMDDSLLSLLSAYNKLAVNFEKILVQFEGMVIDAETLVVIERDSSYFVHKLRFMPMKMDTLGLTVELRPVVEMPLLTGLEVSLVKFTGDLDVEVNPFNINIILRQDEKGWQSFIETNTLLPLVTTSELYIYQKSPSFRDNLKGFLQAGYGETYVLQAGICYKEWGIWGGNLGAGIIWMKSF